MADYLVKIIGHIDERKRPENFPKEIHILEAVANADKKFLVDFVQKQMKNIVYVQGMGVSRDPAAMQDPNKLDTNRMFVPMHMLTHIDAEVTELQQEIPLVDENNNTVLCSGKDVVKN
jgi:hypothetical protein